MAGMVHDMGSDERVPLPLTEMMANHQKQQMRDHLRVIQEVTVALVAAGLLLVIVGAGLSAVWFGRLP